MTSWIIGKLKGFGDSVLSGIKSFFGIASPSRVFRDEVGKMLAVGMAEGIEDNADQPLDAMANLSKGILDEAGELNGLTLERRLQHTFAAPETVSTAESGMLSKLDKILSAIEKGQVLTIDGSALVGATANRMDSALGQRRALAARGAI
jgi:phage-related protein